MSVETEAIFEKARGMVCASLIHEMFQCPGSYTRSGEYYILSPLRPDHNVGSFSINETTGLWIDRAKGDKGDFISLVAQAQGISLLDAAKLITGSHTAYYVTADERAAEKAKREDDAASLPKPLIPIPDSAIESLKNYCQYEKFIELWGNPTTVSRYKNEKNELCFVVVRYEKEKKENETKRQKNDILFYYGVNEKWKAKRHPDLKPFTLFGMDEIADEKKQARKVIIFEGEKKKIAFDRYCEKNNIFDWLSITWIGGSKNIKYSAWSKFKEYTLGRDVYFWPDADSQRDKNGILLYPDEQPGMTAANYIKSIIPELKILDVYRAFPIEGEPAGFDVADYIEQGDDPIEFITEYTPHRNTVIKKDPFHAYRQFIDEYYDHDNLIQFGGWYWSYNKNKHYWKPESYDDLTCNFQRWFEASGYQYALMGAGLNTTEFINKAMQYLRRHSVGYIDGNPMKDSVMSPFVHFQNGAVEFTKKGSAFYPREKYGEDFFRKLVPLSCLDVRVNYSRYATAKPEKDFPAFYYFVKEMIPKTYLTEHAEQTEKIISDTVLYFAQILAYTISSIKENEYIFGLYGNERTGKSFFMKIVKSLIGVEFCSERRIEDMEGRFAISGLWGKKAYIEPDLKTRAPLPEDFIKAYAGEQVTTIEAKNKDPVDGVKMSLAMFFVSNYEFNVHGTEGITRRLMLIPFKNEIKKYDTRLLNKICGEHPHGEESGNENGKTFDERPGLIALALQGWDKYVQDGFLISTPAWIEEYKKSWVKETNTVVKFLEETIVKDGNEYYDEKRNTVYENYQSWCKGEGRKELGKKNFFEEIRKEHILEERRIGSEWRFYYSPSKTVDKKNIDDIPF
jgi:hypothetical protein